MFWAGSFLSPPDMFRTREIFPTSNSNLSILQYLHEPQTPHRET